MAYFIKEDKDNMPPTAIKSQSKLQLTQGERDAKDKFLKSVKKALKLLPKKKSTVNASMPLFRLHKTK